jgi:hypothetical protein
MAIASAASSAGAPPPGWLDTLGKIAGVILGIELLVVLLIVCALMVGLAFALHWVQVHVLPVIQQNAPKVQRAMDLTEKSTDRVVHRVAEFYGRRQAVETGMRVLLFGKKAARRVHDESLIRASGDLQLMETDASFSAGSDDSTPPSAPAGSAADRSEATAAAQNVARHDLNGHADSHDEISTLAGNAG